MGNSQVSVYRTIGPTLVWIGNGACKRPQKWRNKFTVNVRKLCCNLPEAKSWGITSKRCKLNGKQ